MLIEIGENFLWGLGIGAIAAILWRIFQ